MGVTLKNRGENVFGDVVVLDDITINDDCDIVGDIGILGDFTLGVNGTGSDFIIYSDVTDYKIWFDADGDTRGAWYFGANTKGILTQWYGDTTGYYVKFDPSGDTNGAWFFGADTKGIQVNLYGDVTGCGVFWDPTTDTNGTLTIGGTGGSKGNDVIIYGVTSGSYAKWDQSADDLILNAACLVFTGTSVSTIDLSGATSTTDITLSNSATLVNTSNVLTIEEATITMDASTLFGVESADIRLGVSSSIYMDIAVTDTTGDVAITHTGNSKIVTWTTTGGFDFVGAIALDATTVSGILSVTDATAASALGTASLKTAGGIGITQNMWIGQGITMPTTVTGTLFDFVLETEWTVGTLINADVAAGGITLTGDIIGINIDFGSNVTAVTNHDITAFIFNTPTLSQTSTATTTYRGFYIESAGDLDQDTAAGTVNWRGVDLVTPIATCTNATGTVEVNGLTISAAGALTSTDGILSFRGLDIQMPDIIENGGTLTSYGLQITGGAYTTGTETAIEIDDAEIGINFTGAYDHGIYFSEDPVAGDVTNSFINVGDYTTGIAVAPTSANMFGVMHNVSLTDVNVGYWYQGYYTKITTSGTTTDTSVAGHAYRMQIGSSLGAVYGIQCHTNITATNTCANEIISVSAYTDLAAGTTTTTDRVCALQAMIAGSGTAGTVVGDTIVAYLVNAGTVVTTDAIAKIFNQSAATTTDMIHIENDGTCTTMLRIDNDGAATTGIAFEGSLTDGIVFGGTVADEVIEIGGTFDHGIRFTEDPVAGDSDNSFINMGLYGTAIAVAPTTDHMFGVMQNVTLTDVNVAKWYQGYYTKITTSGTTTDTSIAGHALRMQVGSSLGAVYGIQCHTNITATNSCANEIISVSAYVDLAAGTTTTTDRVCALQAMIAGSGTAGTVTGDTFVAYIANRGTVVTTDAIINVHNQSAATAADAIRMDLNGTVTYAFNFAGTVSDGWTTATAANDIAPDGEYVLIPVDVAGTSNPLFLLAAQTFTIT